MKTAEEIAQWVINNRYPKSENNKVSDFEMYNELVKLIANQSKPLPSDEVVKKQMPINEYCQWLEDLTTRGDSIDAKGLEKWIKNYAKNYQPQTKEVEIEETKDWLINNDDFCYTEIDGVDVPTQESIAKVMNRYVNEIIKPIDQPQNEHKCKECKFWVDGCFKDTDSADCFQYSMFQPQTKEIK